MSATPAELLAAWRAAERGYAQAAAGSSEAHALHAEMRRLMDEYEWAVRGRVGRRPPVGPVRRREAQDGTGG
ncbi:MAG TPA: hypothetical protein VGQ02_08425 [Candidatus Limnocylindrales bacterium]|jgi:hypothetical protein|nr:hypothetical protein [Candidatus Limnocylindrales bacterium]